MKKLNRREQVFLLEYLIDFNTERAALAAGYSKSLAHTRAYQWVAEKSTKPYLRAEIDKKMKQLEERTQLTIDRIEEELINIAFSRVTGSFSPGDKLKALELLGKRRGMFKENIELSGNPIGGAQIMIVMPENNRENNE